METTNKKYKSLGNAIRDSVFRAKEAPTMLPDKTIEKLGLGEDDVLSIEDESSEEEEDQYQLLETILQTASSRSKL